MKYMGSKRYLLLNGLGDEIRRLATSHKRIVDLFCGGGSVSWFGATRTSLPVISADLQSYATTLAGAVVTRSMPLDARALGDIWTEEALTSFNNSPLLPLIESWENNLVDNIEVWVNSARELCGSKCSHAVVWAAYGGYYFSPRQALLVDKLLETLPSGEPNRTVCLAALISAASTCAASPGHTAQPFQPTESADRYIRDAWSRDLVGLSVRYLSRLSAMYASTPGEIRTGDANVIAQHLNSTDLVIVDPPYSAVQYSRFYHVLETIARGYKVEVSGRGRYPNRSERPQSSYSRRTEAHKAIAELLRVLSEQGSTVLLTFPVNESSNGLSGSAIMRTAENWFTIEHAKVTNRFSTLGGNRKHRAARTDADELIITMKPH